MLKFKNVLLVLISVALSTTVMAQAGRETGNGGDSLAIEFTMIAREALSEVRSRPKMFPEFDVDHLERAIANTKVVSVEKAKLNGVERDAVNYPSLGLIEINRARWSVISTQEQKKALVFHEYLGILGVRDVDYAVSGRILSQEKGRPQILTERVNGIQVECIPGSMKERYLAMDSLTLFRLGRVNKLGVCQVIKPWYWNESISKLYVRGQEFYDPPATLTFRGTVNETSAVLRELIRLGECDCDLR